MKLVILIHIGMVAKKQNIAKIVDEATYVPPVNVNREVSLIQISVDETYGTI
jgi:hypothetical protein